MEYLLKYFDVNMRIKLNQTCSFLHIAARYGHMEISELLVKYGADIFSISSERSMTVLHEASFKGHIVNFN